MSASRVLRLDLQPEWTNPERDAGRTGLLSTDARAATLVRVLLSYPEVRYVLPDRVSVEPTADPHLLETLTRFLERQHWLVRRVGSW
jgi:hypothetical protein